MSGAGSPPDPPGPSARQRGHALGIGGVGAKSREGWTGMKERAKGGD